MELIQYTFAAIGILGLIHIAWTWPRGAKVVPPLQRRPGPRDNPNGIVSAPVGAISFHAHGQGTAWVTWINVDGKTGWERLE